MKTYNPRQCVELFHLLFLGQLGRKLEKKLYAIKGGCNMRFYFNSIRYSEDLDIDIQIISKETLYKNITQILNSSTFKRILQSYNIEILHFSAPKQTPTTQRWKISLKSSTTTLPLNTKIEFSRRTLSGDVIFETVNSHILTQYALTPIMTNHYTIQRMYEQKIMALALRKETQARDVFDIYLLIHLKNDLKLQDKEIFQYLSIAKANTMTITFTDFKGQVIAYLPEDYQAQYDDESIWHNIVKKVAQSLNEDSHETD